MTRNHTAIELIKLLDVAATAEALGISKRSLWTLTSSRRIPHVRVGRRVLYRPNDIAAFIDSAVVPADGVEA